jgi:hypothetical protein
MLALTGCGGGTFAPPPINLSVSVNNATITVPPNGSAVNVPVTIVAPTETATFTIAGLPAGVSYNYKESESNPSGLLTLMANATTVPGTYMPVITVGSSGQTASVVFTLVISSPGKGAIVWNTITPDRPVHESFIPPSVGSNFIAASCLRVYIAASRDADDCHGKRSQGQMRTVVL